MSQYCTFFLDGLLFGIEAARVQEVQFTDEVTPVPTASDMVYGVINVRGQILTMVDLKRRLDLGRSSVGKLSVSVVVRTADAPISFLVDEVGDVLELSQDTYEKPPETLAGAVRGLIVGAHKLTDRLLLILDTEKALSA